MLLLCLSFDNKCMPVKAFVGKTEKRATSNLSMISAFTDCMNNIIAEPVNVDVMVFFG